MTSGADIVRTARGFLGTPFRHQGRAPGKGLDCAGVVAATAQALGLSDYDVGGYGRLPRNRDLAEHLEAAGMREIALRQARQGDVYLMAFETAPQHLAIATEIGILHAHRGVGAVIEHRLDETWRRRIRHAYRFPGVL